MDIKDLSTNPRIAALTRLTLALERSHTPYETLRTIRRGLAEAYGEIALVMLSTSGLGEGEYRLVLKELNQDSIEEAIPWDQGQHPVYRGGVFASIIANRRPEIIHDIDWATDPNLHDTLAGFGSIIAIPFASDRLPMNWVILLKQNPDRFTSEELEQSMLRTMFIGSILESQTLAEDLASANEKIAADVRELAHLQRSLLPDPLPHIVGLDIAASYEPSGSAGGDWYDIFPLDEDDGAPSRWCIFIGDASGHGLAAAVVMAMVQSILHAHPRDSAGPADLLLYANRHLCRKKIGGFVTAFLGVYDPQARVMVYASAGHPPPLLRTCRAGKVLRLDAVASYPIGIDPTESFSEATVQLRPGDTLLLYTDGITEARGANRAMFEVERLEVALSECDQRPDRLIARLREAVQEHQEGRGPVDDQTMVAARCL